MNETQLSLFRNTVGVEASWLYLFIGSTMIAVFGLLMIKLLRGSMSGWSSKNISGYEMGSRVFRLILIFNILIFIVAI